MTNCFEIHLPISNLPVADQNKLRLRAQALFAEQQFRPAFAKSAELQAIQEAIRGHVDEIAAHPMIVAAGKMMARSTIQENPNGMTVQAVKETLVRQLGAPIQKWLDTGRMEVVQTWQQVREKYGDLLDHDLLMSIEAWHGSAAEFDKFLWDHIGSGEAGELGKSGAYGYGHYVSTLRGVAEAYRDQLIAGSKWTEAFKNAASHGMGNKLATMMASSYIDGEHFSDFKTRALDESFLPHEIITEAERAFQSGNAKSAWESMSGRGALYQVSVTPNHEDFLDFNKTLGEQSPQVKEGIAKVWQQLHKRGNAPPATSNGEEFYHFVSNNIGGDELASKAFFAAGIPGNAYIGDKTKSGGVGAQNYVLFDDSLVNITAKFSKYNLAPNGLYIPGHGIILIADGLSQDNAKGTALHELFHAALSENPELLDGIPDLLDAIDATRKDMATDPWVIEAEKRVRNANTKQSAQAEEFGAYAIGEYAKDPQSIPEQIRKVIEKFVAAIRMALVRAGLYTPKHVTQADLTNLAVEWLNKGAYIKNAEAETKVMFSYLGKNAATANLSALDKAKALETLGGPMMAIRRQIGWFRGVDEEWRFEVSDTDVDWIRPFKDLPESLTDSYRLEDVIHAPKLFEAYPELREVKFKKHSRLMDFMGTTLGWFNPDSNTLVVTPNANNGTEALSTALHEIQHWIQAKEGFASGGNTSTTRFDNEEALQKTKGYLELVIDTGSQQSAKQADALLSKVNAVIAKQDTFEYLYERLDDLVKEKEDISAAKKKLEADIAELAATELAQYEAHRAARAKVNKQFTAEYEVLSAELSALDDKYFKVADYPDRTAIRDEIYTAKKSILEKRNALHERRMDSLDAFDAKEKELWPEGRPYAFKLKESFRSILSGFDDQMNLVDDDLRGIQSSIEREGDSSVALTMYRLIAGEREARDTQARMNFNEDSRNLIHPYSSEGIPDEYVIIPDAAQLSSSLRGPVEDVNKEIVLEGLRSAGWRGPHRVAVLKNPTAARAYRIATEDMHGEIRAFTDPRNGDVYISPASTTFHNDLAMAAGIPYSTNFVVNPIWETFDFDSNTFILDKHTIYSHRNNRLFVDDANAPGVMYSLPEEGGLLAPIQHSLAAKAPSDVFANKEEAVQHLVNNFGPGITSLVNNGVLQFTHGKAEWATAIRHASTDQAWIDEQLKGIGNRQDAEEMTLKGRVYFDLDALAKDKLVSVATHSIGEHFNLEKMIGAENYANLQNQIANRAKIKGSIEEKVWNQTARNYAHLEAGSRPFIAEVIAKLGEVRPNAPWYKRLIATVKAYLLRMGFGKWVNGMTATDLHALLVTSLQAAARGASKEALFGEGAEAIGLPIHPLSPTNADILYSLPANQVPDSISLAHNPVAQDALLRKVANALDASRFGDTAVGRAVREAVEAPQRQLNDAMTYMYDGTYALKGWVTKVSKAIANFDEETSDPWLAAKRYQSYTMLLNAEFDVEERMPLLQKMTDKHITPDQLDDYMWARSAKDRNAKIAASNPGRYPDGGSGMATADAAAILAGRPVTLFPGTPDESRIEFADPQLRADLEELSVMKDNIVHGTIDLAVMHGILPKEVGESWKVEEPLYSPLFRDLEGDDFLHGAGSGTGFDVRGKVSKRATGSGRPVSNVLGNVFDMRQKVISNGVKASGVGRAAFNMAIQAPAPGYYAAVDPQANPIHYIEPHYPDVTDGGAMSRYNKAYAKLQAVVGPQFATLEQLAPKDANGLVSLGHIRLMNKMITHRYYANGAFRRAMSMAEMQEAMDALPVSVNGAPVQTPTATGARLLTAGEYRANPNLAPAGAVSMIPGTYGAGHERFAKLVQQTIEIGLSPTEIMGYINELATPTVVGQGANRKVKYVINPALRNRDNVFATEVNGEVKFIFFNSRNHDAMQIARALKNLDASELGEVTEKVAQMTRLFASLNTQYSLFFGPFNMMRDFHMAYLTTKHMPFSNYTQLFSYTKTAVKMFHPWFGALVKAEHEGKAFVPKNRDEAAMYDAWIEAKKAGMPVGFTEMFGKPTDRKKKMASELKKLEILSKTNGGAWNYLHKNAYFFVQWVSDNNESIEVATRLAVFKQAIDAKDANGKPLYSKARAAAIAKDATVDFNQKGTIAPQIGAWFAFFNASIGGTINTIRALNGPAGRQILYGGLVLGAVQAAMLAAAGFDDDDPSESTRQKNFIIPLPDGGWFGIPYPLGFHVLVSASRIPMQAILSNNQNRGAKPVFDMAALLAEGVSPVGSGSVAQTFTPTIFDPIMSWVENKDWQSRSIYHEDYNSLDPTPAYLRAKSGASGLAVWLSKEASNLTGGDQYVPGAANIPPDALEYTVTQYAGAPARDISRVIKWISGGVTGDIPPMYTVPLVGRMVGKTGKEAGESAVFYRNVTELNRHERELKGLMKDNPSAVPEYLANHPEAALAKAGGHMYRKIGELHREKRELIEKGAPKTEVERLGDEATQMMKGFNAKVAGLMK